MPTTRAADPNENTVAGPKSTTKVLNTAYISTIIVDYICIVSFVAAFGYFCGDIGDMDPKERAIRAPATLLLIPFLYTTRETLQWYTHGSVWSTYKTKFRLVEHTEFFMDIVKSILSVLLGVAWLAHKGWIDFSWMTPTQGNGWLTVPAELFVYGGTDYGGFINSMMIMSRDFWVSTLIKDNICMRYIHPWMHKRENYWLHKHHHQGRRDTNIVHSFVFDALDQFLEFTVALMFGLYLNKVMFGEPSLHLLAVMWMAWTDANTHSENPYTQCFGNPFLDYFFKMTITHNLHHASEMNLKYMCLYPYHHFMPGELAKDVEKYNKIFKTSIDFSFFISPDANKALD